MNNNEQKPNDPQQPDLNKAGVSSSNPVKELKVAKLLEQMMNSNMKLYEQILDEPRFAFYFNELVNLARK